MAISELARKVFLTYFVTHIPATMLIDAQVVLPPRVVPTFARNALRWHISTNNDVLMAHQPAWLRSLVMCELVFQLPFFFVAISALRRRDEGAKGWLLAYGAHTATTLAPILQYIWESDAIASELERWKLIGCIRRISSYRCGSCRARSERGRFSSTRRRRGARLRGGSGRRSR